MKPASFLPLYDKLEKLVHRLPESLEQPILREITPIKTIFLLQRAPRLALLGERSAAQAELINALFGEEIVQPREEMLRDGVWQTLSRTGRGSLELLDLRHPVSLAAARSALAASPPDAYLFLGASRASADELNAAIEHARRVVEEADQRHTSRPRMLGLQLRGDAAARDQLHAALHGERALEARLIGTFGFSGEVEELSRMTELLAAELPPEARLELARVTSNRGLQKEIAQVLVKSITAICAAIGAQPIPLADFPILTSLQTTMVAGVMHISGREMSLRLGGEFIAALGANVGVGLVLREGARTAARLVPVWGSAISSAVAGAGTYAIGRSAIAYFIEGTSLKDARGIFRRGKKAAPLLKK